MQSCTLSSDHAKQMWFVLWNMEVLKYRGEPPNGVIERWRTATPCDCPIFERLDPKSATRKTLDEHRESIAKWMWENKGVVIEEIKPKPSAHSPKGFRCKTPPRLKYLYKDQTDGLGELPSEAGASDDEAAASDAD